MTTWADVRKDILTLLDEDRDASALSDIRIAVDNATLRHRNSLLNERKPRSLLTSAAVTVSLTDATVFVPLGVDGTYGAPPVAQPGFHVVDFWQIHSFLIWFDGEDESAGRKLELVDWDVWLGAQSYGNGNQRLTKWVTLSPDNKFYMAKKPGSGQTWTAKLWYWPTLSAITDNGTPEIPDEHINVLIYNVCLDFPNLFEGEARQLMYATIIKNRDDALIKFRRDGKLAQNLRFRPRGRIKGAQLSTRNIWGE